jgi:predicted MFS family arabinose efflux permease
MIGVGVGEVLGALLNSQIQDRLGNRVSLYVNVTELCLAMVSLIYYCINDTYSLWFGFTFNLFWGFQDAGVNNFVMCICGF